MHKKLWKNFKKIVFAKIKQEITKNNSIKKRKQNNKYNYFLNKIFIINYQKIFYKINIIKII